MRVDPAFAARPAVPMASAANLAAPRAEFAVPPRSLVAAITARVNVKGAL